MSWSFIRVSDPISVFIVDDSALVRSALTLILNKVSDIEVLGTAANPKLALLKMKKRWPDVIISDIEMPEMNGLEFLDYLNNHRPTPFIVCSSYAGVGVQNSIDALDLGAVDIISKPSLGVESYLEEITGTIIESIRAAASCRMSPKMAIAKTRAGSTSQPAGKAETRPISVIAIGSSTGGTTVIEYLLRRLSRQSPPVLIVQHMPMFFTDAFARRLNSVCTIAVKEAEDGEQPQNGTAYIAPGGKHMQLVLKGQHYALRVFDGPQVNRHKPSVDILFDSVAEVLARSAIGIILTGMGKDGAQGLLRMKQRGAYTLAQDESSSVVYGMPKAAVDIGATDSSLSVAAIATYLENLSAG